MQQGHTVGACDLAGWLRSCKDWHEHGMASPETYCKWLVHQMHAHSSQYWSNAGSPQAPECCSGLSAPAAQHAASGPILEERTLSAARVSCHITLVARCAAPRHAAAVCAWDDATCGGSQWGAACAAGHGPGQLRRHAQHIWALLQDTGSTYSTHGMDDVNTQYIQLMSAMVPADRCSIMSCF